MVVFLQYAKRDIAGSSCDIEYFPGGLFGLQVKVIGSEEA